MAGFGSRKTEAMLHTKLGFWEQMVNRRQGFEVEGGVDGGDGE